MVESQRPEPERAGRLVDGQANKQDALSIRRKGIGIMET